MIVSQKLSEQGSKVIKKQTTCKSKQACDQKKRKCGKTLSNAHVREEGKAKGGNIIVIYSFDRQSIPKGKKICTKSRA